MPSRVVHAVSVGYGPGRVAGRGIARWVGRVGNTGTMAYPRTRHRSALPPSRAPCRALCLSRTSLRDHPRDHPQDQPPGLPPGHTPGGPQKPLPRAYKARFRSIYCKVSQNRGVSPKSTHKACRTPYFIFRVGMSALQILRFPIWPAFSG